MQEIDPSHKQQPEASLAEKIPHSGVHHDEGPVDKFDNTELADAAERGLVRPVPDTPAELIEAAPKKRRRGLVIGASAVVAGAAIVAGSIIGIKAADNANAEGAPAPDPDQTTQVESPAPDDSATPDAEPTPAETELSIPERIAQAEIPAGLATEEYAKTLFERETDWANAGANDELRMTRLDANESWDEFLPKVAAENTLVYAPALFGPNWRDEPSVVEYVGKMEAMNLGVLKIYVSTAWNANEHPENIEAYRYWREPADPQLVSDDGTGRAFQFKVMNYDNADRNLAQDGDSEKNNGKILMRLSTEIVGDAEYITGITEFIQY